MSNMDRVKPYQFFLIWQFFTVTALLLITGMWYIALLYIPLAALWLCVLALRWNAREMDKIDESIRIILENSERRK